MLHPASDRLEAYVEDSLDGSDRAVLESHLISCARCQSEVDELRALFTTLAALPRLVPTPGFADRVMAGVRIQQPWALRVAAWLRRWVPSGTTGWALVTAILSLPVLLAGGATAWLLSQPRFTVHGLWLMVRDRTVDAALSLAGRAATAAIESNIALRFWEWVTALPAGFGAGELGAAAALLATVTAGSGWILYQNLFRSSTREKTYGTYCF